MRTKNKQMANRDLLKEAIADAKAVKETAIANAKAALEEAFTPMLREKLAKKIAEMDELEETSLEYTKMSGQDYANFCKENPNDPGCLSEADEKEKKEVKENEEMDEAEDMDEAEKMDEVDLDELLRELESMDEDEMYETETMDEAKKKDEKKKDLKEEELINDPKKSTSHGNVAEEDEKKDDEDASEDEEIDLENMDENDLKKFIEDVIADMVTAGELEGNIEKGDEDEVEVTDEDEVEMKEVKSGNPYDTEDAIAYGKYLDSLEEAKKAKKEMDEMKKELDEAYSALATIKAELNEVNLFNAKLLYTNKIFKAKNLTESQKVKVLAAFDKAASVNEAKLVFETLSEGFKEKKSPVNESMLRGSASKPAGIVEKKPILEVNNQFARWQQLAGIKK